MPTWLALMWPVIKELMASVKDSPELQNRGSKGSITKTVIVILLVATVTLGDTALEVHSELQKLKQEARPQQQVEVKAEPSLSEDRVQFLLSELKLSQAQTEIKRLEATVADFKQTIKERDEEIRELRRTRPTARVSVPKPSTDRSTQEKLNALKDQQ